MANEYSDTWFRVFLDSTDIQQTTREVNFICRHLPLAQFPSILDLCCGSGRHAHALALQKYQVTGVDKQAFVLNQAREQTAPTITYLQHDMRRLDEVAGAFDGVLCLWQSFGYFDESTNQDVLHQIYRKLQPRGRFILDIYHRGFFEAHQGHREYTHNDERISSLQTMQDKRLTVHISYEQRGKADVFDSTLAIFIFQKNKRLLSSRVRFKESDILRSNPGGSRSCQIQ